MLSLNSWIATDKVVTKQKRGGDMLYYAKGIRDLLQTHQLNTEFYEHLNEFQIQFVELCFKQSFDEKMGLMTEVEAYNLKVFNHYKSAQFVQKYGVVEEYWKKSFMLVPIHCQRL